MSAAPLYDELGRMPEGGQAFWPTTSDGTRIRTAVWHGSGDKTILIFPGRTEFIEKYGDVIARLLDRSYSVAIIDWRGQGLSDRHPTKREMGWVREFDEYQLDIAELLKTVSETGLPRPYALIAHSMGGAIGLRALLNGLDVEKVIFSGPMWGIHVEPNMRAFASVVASVGPKIGFGEKFVPTGGPGHYVIDEPFAGNVLTNDEPSYDVMTSHLRQHTELGLGAPSIRWWQRARVETAKLVKLAPPKHDCLCLLGTDEAIVSCPAIRTVMAKWPNGKLVDVPDAQHEVLMEGRDQLALVWSEIDAHLA
ncbi:MAG: alpha/beta hydrolase [Amylibacter sp.]